MSRVTRVGMGLVGAVIGVLAVVALREATLSTHQPVDPASRMEVVLEVESEGGERGQSTAEMAEALLLTCRLEVSSDVTGEIEQLDELRFRAVLVPALDETNQRQFRGCLEDWTIDQLLVDVVSLEQVSVPSTQ